MIGCRAKTSRISIESPIYTTPASLLSGTMISYQEKTLRDLKPFQDMVRLGVNLFPVKGKATVGIVGGSVFLRGRLNRQFPSRSMAALFTRVWQRWANIIHSV